MDIRPLLQQIRALDRSADTTEERVITERVTNRSRAPAPKEGPTLAQKAWICQGLLQSEKKTSKENGVARLPSHKCERRVGSVTGILWRTTRGLLSPAGSFTRDARQKEQKGQPIGG